MLACLVNPLLSSGFGTTLVGNGVDGADFTDGFMIDFEMGVILPIDSLLLKIVFTFGLVISVFSILLTVLATTLL